MKVWLLECLLYWHLAYRLNVYNQGSYIEMFCQCTYTKNVTKENSKYWQS